MQTFSCPSCGGGLEYGGGGRTLKCTYCGTVVQVPDALSRPAEQDQGASQARKLLIWFLVLTVGVPSCLGIVGTLVGVGGGILGAILPFVLGILGH